MSIDSIGNFLTVIRNGIMVARPSITTPHSKMRYAIANILKDEGFIRDVVVIDQDNNKKALKVILKYVDGESAIHEIQRASTPGRRKYTKTGNIQPVIGGLGLSILTTNRGVISHKQAEELGVGGEVICTVW
ncbi:MAG TPA: 30S ribosomal protein S8 [Candidatus Dependentiae bacterium]|nr:30S ribosomal protein S8 [Candidatus Dependentiae bacterium]HRQ62312.1 30S ribosomal protein S8 [Candidatus Dependentiae bacterium]